MYQGDDLVTRRVLQCRAELLRMGLSNRFACKFSRSGYDVEQLCWTAQNHPNDLLDIPQVGVEAIRALQRVLQNQNDTAAGEALSAAA